MYRIIEYSTLLQFGSILTSNVAAPDSPRSRTVTLTTRGLGIPSSFSAMPAGRPARTDVRLSDSCVSVWREAVRRMWQWQVSGNGGEACFGGSEAWDAGSGVQWRRAVR